MCLVDKCQVLLAYDFCLVNSSATWCNRMTDAPRCHSCSIYSGTSFHLLQWDFISIEDCSMISGLNCLEIGLFWNFWDILVCLLIDLISVPGLCGIANFLVPYVLALLFLSGILLGCRRTSGRLLFWLLASLAQSRITTQPWCNWSTDVPGCSPSSIYSGTSV